MQKNYENTSQVPQDESRIPEQGPSNERPTLWGKASDSWNATPKQKKLTVLYVMLAVFIFIFLYEAYRLLVIFNVL